MIRLPRPRGAVEVSYSAFGIGECGGQPGRSCVRSLRVAGQLKEIISVS